LFLLIRLSATAFISKLSKMVGSSHETETVSWQVDPASWEWTFTPSDSIRKFLKEKIYHGPQTFHLLTKSHSVRFLPLPYHKESSQGSHLKRWKRSGGFWFYSKQPAGEWLLEMIQQQETTPKFVNSCRRKLLWRRTLCFRIEYNTVLSVSTVLSFNCQTSETNFRTSI
jgi:hypothetical protein